MILTLWNRIAGIGLCRPETDPWGMPGWRRSSWGYHGDDGNKFHHATGLNGIPFAGPYGVGDTIGCGIDMRTATLFFTKNGENLGELTSRLQFTALKNQLTPFPQAKRSQTLEVCSSLLLG